MSTELSQSLQSSFCFGLENSRVADYLEKVASGIRAGKVLPQEVTQSTYSKTDDFETRGLFMRFAEKL